LANGSDGHRHSTQVLLATTDAVPTSSNTCRRRRASGNLTHVIVTWREWAVPSTRSTLPAISAGTLADTAQPVLSAVGGLLLRPWEATDAAVFVGAYRDSEIQRWHTRQPMSEDQVREWFDQYRRDWARERGAHWAVTGSRGEVLGRIAMRGLDLDDGVAACAYWVLPAARGKGVASRALSALSVWALDETGFHRLELDHSTRNTASCRVAVKSGFLLEGTKRSAAVHVDGRHDMHLHARIRGDEPSFEKGRVPNLTAPTNHPEQQGQRRTAPRSQHQ
jgi:RimJ/RimL family protein N-acetyltransferase